MTAPIAHIAAGAVVGTPPLWVSFTAAASQATTDGASLVTYEWDFGDGGTHSTDQALASHTYIETGSFTVVLTVTDSNNESSSTSTVVTVTRNAPAVATVAAQYTAEVWADYGEFALANSCDVETAIQVLTEATYILSGLTNGRIHGELCWRDEYRAPLTRQIDVTHGPIKSVDAVYLKHECADDTTAVDFCVSSNRTVMLTSNNFVGAANARPWSGGYYDTFLSCGCAASLGRYIIEYTQASTLVPGADRATIKLAQEYLNAINGRPCKLPERITSVTRQGMSWTILDPQDFLTRGLTGISVIDHWLTSVKRTTDSLKMTDPLNGVLIESTALDCSNWQPLDEDRGVGSDNAAGYYPITVTSGDVFRGEPFDLEKAGVPWVLNSAIAQVRTELSPTADKMLDLTVEINGGRVTIGAGDLMNLPAGSYVWDFQGTDDEGPVTILWGPFTVNPEVSA